MKAIKYTGSGILELKHVPIPKISQPTDVLVKVEFAGFCATDLEIKEGHYFVPVGTTLGHEIAGSIEEVGSECKLFTKGDRVILNPHGFCNSCKHCSERLPHFCLGKNVAPPIGLGSDGGIANFVIAQERRCVSIPPDLPFERAVLTEPVSCILHSLSRGRPINNESRVLIMGGGFIGTLATFCISEHSPRKIVVCEICPKRIENLLAFNMPNVTIVTPAELVHEKETHIKDAAYGYDMVFDYTGADSAIQLGFNLLATRGCLILFGIMQDSSTVKFKPTDILYKELTITASLSSPHQMLAAVNKVNQFCKSGLLNFNKLQIRIFPVEEYEEAINLFKSHNYTKVIFKMN